MKPLSTSQRLDAVPATRRLITRSLRAMRETRAHFLAYYRPTRGGAPTNERIARLVDLFRETGLYSPTVCRRDAWYWTVRWYFKQDLADGRIKDSPNAYWDWKTRNNVSTQPIRSDVSTKP